MRSSSLALTLIGFLLTAASATATSYSHRHCPHEFADYDYIGTKLIAWDSDPSNDSYRGWFNLLNDGYDPHKYWIKSAKAWFLLKDDSRHDSEEWVEIDLTFDGENYGSLGPVEVDMYDWLGGSLGSRAIFKLNETGRLQYTVTATYGDVYLKKAKLIACAKHHRKPVPDSGSSIALLGASLLGFAALRKKLLRR